MALSLTEATPSMTSPSPGISSPASTITMSPTLRSVAGIALTSRPSGVDQLAGRQAAILVRRRLSACALPRPSATASAKVANSTVNQSQTAIWPEKADAAAGRDRAGKQRHQGRDDFGDEDHRVAHQRARVELDERPAATAGTRMAGSNRLCAMCGMLGHDDCLRKSGRPASRNARRWGRARAPGRIAGRRGSG